MAGPYNCHPELTLPAEACEAASRLMVGRLMVGRGRDSTMRLSGEQPAGEEKADPPATKEQTR
jgi:hypothetical protein